MSDLAQHYIKDLPSFWP